MSKYRETPPIVAETPSLENIKNTQETDKLPHLRYINASVPLPQCFPLGASGLDQDAKQLELRGLMTQSYLLRQRMVHFMQNLVYYMMVEVPGYSVLQLLMYIDSA